MKSALQYVSKVLFLLEEEKKKIPFLISLFLVVTLLDVLSVSLVSPYIALIMELSPLDNNILVERVSVFISINSYADAVIWIGLLLLAAFFLKGVAAIAALSVIYRFSWRQNARLRARLVDRYQNMPYNQFVNKNSAHYLQATQEMTMRYSSALQTFLRLACEAMVAVSLVSYVAIKHGMELTYLVLLIGSIALGYDRLFRNQVQVAGKKAIAQNTKAIQKINEAISGYKEIQILGKQEQFNKIIKNESMKACLNYYLAQIVGTVPRYLYEFALVLFFISLAYFSIVVVDEPVGNIFPMLGLFVVVALRLLPTATLVTTGLARLRFNHAPIMQLVEDIQLEPAMPTKNRSRNVVQLGPEFRQLKLHDLQFRYSKNSDWVIDGVSLDINAGEAIGIIGKSGSGKTTLIDLLLGLLKPENGDVLVNGIPLGDCIQEWRRWTVYLPQEGFLFDGTIRQNVTVNFDGDDDNELFESAIQNSNLLEIIQKLPDGEDTYIGERGARLSGGQRQRISIARAMYHRRQVLIFDEAASALDPDSRSEVRKKIVSLKGRNTIIVISHDIDLLHDCDRVFRVENGQLIGQSVEILES